MEPIIYGSAAIAILAAVWIAHELRTSPYGYEDEAGFGPVDPYQVACVRQLHAQSSMTGAE